MTDTPPPPPPPIQHPEFTPKRHRRWPKRAGIGVGVWLALSAIVYPFVPHEAETAEDEASVTTEAPAPPTTTRASATTTAAPTTSEVPTRDRIAEAVEDARDEALEHGREAVENGRTLVDDLLDRATTENPTATVPPTVPVVATFMVANVVDGDTLDLDNGERVRLVGIDTPDRGECGYDEAKLVLASLVLNQPVTLEPSDEDRDSYDRLLRYVLVNGVDVGGQMLAQGYAITRYNSTDGYGLHPREAEYASLVQLPAVTCVDVDPSSVTGPRPTSDMTYAEIAAQSAYNARHGLPFDHGFVGLDEPVGAVSDVSYRNCDEVRAAGAAPIFSGDPGWQSKFDRDGDGVGCE